MAPKLLTLRGWSELIFGAIVSEPLALFFDYCALLLGVLLLAGAIFLSGRDKPDLWRDSAALHPRYIVFRDSDPTSVLSNWKNRAHHFAVRASAWSSLLCPGLRQTTSTALLEC